jgi:hypothetical protein
MNKEQEPQQNTDEKLENNIEETASELEEAAEEKAEEVTEEKAEEPSEEKAEEAVSDAADEDSEESEVENSGSESEELSEEDGEEEKTVIEIPDPVSEEEKAANEKFRKLSLIEKCKQDPLIPVCAILAILALIVAGIYFLLPNAMTPSMGMTLQEFQTRYNNGEVNKSHINSGADIGFRSPSYVDIKSQPSILGSKEVISAKSAYADFFNGPLKYFSIGGIEGATRKSDNMLSYVRVYVLYGEGEGDFNTIWLYASNTISALYPELSMYQAMDIAMTAMNEFNGDERFYVKGDFAFRLVATKKTGDGGIEYAYIVVDVVPRSALKADQIRKDLDVASASVPASESVSDTTAATTAATK